MPVGWEEFTSPTVLAVLAGIVGACIGSFLNVCIHRLPRGESIVWQPSYCPGCRAAIAWYDNVPVFAWVALGGRCRRCRAPISWRYPLVEAATAALFVLLFLGYGLSFTFFLYAGFGAALVALIVIDAQVQLLPNAITLPGIAVGLLTSPFHHRTGTGFLPQASLAAVLDACLAAALGYAVLWGINAAYRGWQSLRGVPAADREDGIGQGDFKLLAMIGAFLGVRLLVFSLFFGAISGALFGVVMLSFAGYGWKSKLPYGVFLGAAALLALFVGESWIGWYLRSAGLVP
jgi:leader peptidase (prepilin peptidase)/N-methyltransferase